LGLKLRLTPVTAAPFTLHIPVRWPGGTTKACPSKT
jgi:hypothetical protein